MSGPSISELTALSMTRLSPSELTGRSRSHLQSDDVRGCVLHLLARQALDQMTVAARSAGIEMAAISCFRSFEQQLGIWNSKFLGQRELLSASGTVLNALSLGAAERVEAILVWSALPGASRHHWGTDFDLIDRAALPPGQSARLVPEEYQSGGWFAPLTQWLDHHAADYGFFRPYDIDRGGVSPEPWHLSFAPLAAPALQDLTIDVLADSLSGAALEGRDIVFTRLPELHRRYVLAVAEPPARALVAPALSHS